MVFKAYDIELQVCKTNRIRRRNEYLPLVWGPQVRPAMENKNATLFRDNKTMSSFQSMGKDRVMSATNILVPPLLPDDSASLPICLCFEVR